MNKSNKRGLTLTLMLALICFTFDFVASQSAQLEHEALYRLTFKKMEEKISIYCTQNSDTFYNLLYEHSPVKKWLLQCCWNISGYWDNNVFVVDRVPYNDALEECRKWTGLNRIQYKYVQPVTKNGWHKFVINGTGEIMPGYDPKPAIIQTTKVYCTKDDPSDFSHLYASPITKSKFWEIRGYWDATWNFVVDQSAYNAALQGCQKQNYTYIQPGSAGWRNFKIAGFNLLMPGYDGDAPKGSIRTICTRNNAIDYGYLYRPPQLKRFWYISGKWEKKHFVVRQSDYKAALQACIGWNYLYVQPAGTYLWNRFKIKENRQVAAGYDPRG